MKIMHVIKQRLHKCTLSKTLFISSNLRIAEVCEEKVSARCEKLQMFICVSSVQIEGLFTEKMERKAHLSFVPLVSKVAFLGSAQRPTLSSSTMMKI